MPAKIDKQTAGFKFGKYRLSVVQHLGSVSHNGRTYCSVRVQTHDGQEYISLRLYNGGGKFIKQFLMEPGAVPAIAKLLEGKSARSQSLPR